MKFSAEHELVVAALLNVQREIQPIVKDAKNPMLNSTYATLAAITDYARPVLARHDLFVVQGGGEPHDALGITLLSMKTRLVHTSGQWVENVVYAPIAEQNSKDGKERKATAQTAGSVITYLRRYGLSALLALTTDEDDDGNRASRTQKRESRAAARSITQEANDHGATSVADFPYPPVTGQEEWRGKKLKECPLTAIEVAYDRTKDETSKRAQQIHRAMENELERRREHDDLTVLHPSLEAEAHTNGAR